MDFTFDELLRALDRVPAFQKEDYDDEEKAEMLEYRDYYTPGCLISWDELAWEAEHDRAKVTINDVEYLISKVHETGGMDKGSDACYVFKIGQVYIKKEGFYASHYGNDWDGDLYQVEPFEKTIVDYKRV